MSACATCGKCPCYEHERKTVMVTDNPKATHSSFMSAWHSTRLSCSTVSAWDHCALRLAAYADQLHEQLEAERKRADDFRKMASDYQDKYGVVEDDRDELRATLQAAERLVAEVRAALSERQRDNYVSGMALGIALDRYDRPSTPDGKGGATGGSD